jgi:hypothetical protein
LEGLYFVPLPNYSWNLKRTVKQRALEKSANEVQLKSSTLGSEAGAIGAGRLISEIVVERLYQGS